MLIARCLIANSCSYKNGDGVTFDDAIHVFEDPNAQSIQDRSDESGELRWQAVGLVSGLVVLLVAHTVRREDGCEIIRLISARHTTRKERKRYEEACKKNFDW